MWTGSALALAGAAGLWAGWLLVAEAGTATAVLAVLSMLALAAGVLLAASTLGPLPVRITGGLLFAAGLAVAVTQHQVWWWLPNDWATPVSVTALVISLAGLGVLVLAYGFGRAGLSGALGLLALTCLVLMALPYLGSEDQAVLRAFGTALGAAAFATGVAATGRRRAAVVTGVAGAAATAFAGYASYQTYAPTGYRAAVVGATVGGILAAVGSGVRWPAVFRRPFRGRPRSGAPPAESAPPTPADPASATPATPTTPTTGPVPGPGPAATAAASSVTAPSAAVAPARPGAGMRGRLETASLIVGLVVGVLTIAKELIAAALALFG